MLLALRLLYEKVSSQVLFPVIGRKSKRKLRPPVQPLYQQSGEAELPGIALHASLGELYVTGSAKALLSSASTEMSLGILSIQGDATVPLKGLSAKFETGYEPPFSSITLGTRKESSDDEEALIALFLGSQ